MSKITLNNVGSLIDSTTAQATINANSAVIQTAFDNTLSRDGTNPNVMSALIDMNSEAIVNLPEPIGDTSPLRLQDLKSFIGGGTIQTVPSGGTTGQSLQKNSNTNYDVKWGGNVSSVGLALPADFTITGSPVTTAGTLTGAWVNTPTGTGGIVRATSPTLVTPALGTPSALIGTNITGTAAGLTTGTVTTNANLTGPITSTGNVTLVASQTGTGSKFVMDTSPTLVTPNLGTPSAAVLTSATGLPITTGVSGLAAGVATFLATPTSANLAAAVTNETGTGVLVFGTSPTITTPNIVGTVAVGNATAGSLGEYVVGITAPTSYTSASVINVTSISLTAGDWDVSGMLYISTAASTNVTLAYTSISSTSGTADFTLGNFAELQYGAGIVPGANTFSINAPTVRFNVSTTTTIFLIGSANFTVSTASMGGQLRARRIR